MDTKQAKAFTKRGLPAELKAAVKAAQAKKAEEVQVLDLREAASFTDYFIILHGNSSRQNAALSEAIAQELKKDGVRPLGVEGTAHGEWILMDYGFFVVHVFSKQARDYYLLDRLWGDAAKLIY
ncbi:MAG: ribosome silencing factor [Candidatus Aminicenantes bacterium]|nr:ribosome silencing factor [Candidatus Aminicenantes bacterium]